MTSARRAVLHRVQPVAAEHAAAAALLSGDPEAWLPAPARRRGVDRWTVELVAGPVHRSVACGIGSVWQLGDDVWRTVTWQAVPQDDEPLPSELALPTLRGELGLVAGASGSSLVLNGTYDPPAGLLGIAADRVVLHRVADATAGIFLVAVARKLAAGAAPAVAQAAAGPGTRTGG